MTDAHLHLQDVPEEQRPVLFRCLTDNQFKAVFCNSTSPDDWEVVLSFSRALRFVIPFVGVHPSYAAGVKDDWEQSFMDCLKTNRCGVGEIGLDLGPKGKDFKKQTAVFSRQIKAALMLRRPVVLHCVRAWDEMMGELRAVPICDVPVIVHSFIGSQGVLRELLQMGAMISIGQRSLGQRSAQAMLAEIPLTQLLMETDFPYLPGRGPEGVVALAYLDAINEVYTRTAGFLNLPLESLRERVEQNIEKIAGLIQGASL